MSATLIIKIYHCKYVMQLSNKCLLFFKTLDLLYIFHTSMCLDIISFQPHLLRVKIYFMFIKILSILQKIILNNTVCNIILGK